MWLCLFKLIETKMKFAIILVVLALFATSIAAANVKVWGVVRNSRPVHEQQVVLGSRTLRGRSQTIKYTTPVSSLNIAILYYILVQYETWFLSVFEPESAWHHAR